MSVFCLPEVTRKNIINSRHIIYAQLFYCMILVLVGFFQASASERQNFHDLLYLKDQHNFL